MAAAVSTVPACLDALVQATRLALPGVQVVDGQPDVELQGDLILIGFTGHPGEAAVVDARTRRQYAPSPDRESYDITCLCSSWPGGNTDIKAARDRAYELVDAMAGELARDATLGGVVQRARLTAAMLGQEQTTSGATATVVVTVHVDAYTRRS